MSKLMFAISVILLTSGCANFEQLQAEGREIRMRGAANPYGFYTQTITTPQGTYTVRGSNVTGTQIYRNK